MILKIILVVIIGIILEGLKEAVIRIITEKVIKWMDSHVLKKKKVKKKK
jgi:hypothetical protein